MKIALAMIVKGTDEEAKVLDRCLETISPYVDGIFITSTYKADEAYNLEVAKVCKKYNATVTGYQWTNNFSEARNFSFSQVPKDFDYIMWSDADDVWRGLEKLKLTIEENKEVDAFAFWYMYDFDEYKKPTVVHKKTMVVRNDGCVEWAGALHEDFKENRGLNSKFIEGIERLHLSNEERFGVAAVRNVEVSKADMEQNPDDPRVYWNYANSLISIGKFSEAEEAFNTFIKTSQSDEEKFLARIRLAEICYELGNKEKALEHHYIAIGMKPLYPDGYIKLGYYYFNEKQPKLAEEYLLLGITKKPPYHSIIAYNPRDYDYNPMMMLSKVYIQLARPDMALPLLKGCLKIYPDHSHLKPLVEEMEKATKEMDEIITIIKDLRSLTDKEEVKKKISNIPKKYQSHPAVSAMRNEFFVKETSTGKDIAIYCGLTDHEWNPVIYETKGFGGSEEAVYYMSKELSKKGWNVTVYANIGTEQMEKYGVTWKPFWEFNTKDKWDKLVIWRHSSLCDYDLNAEEIFIDMHDVIPPGEFNEKRLKKIKKIFVKSQAHKILFPHIPEDKFVVIPNGLDTSLFEKKVKKDHYLMINTSSADRSLDTLLQLFKRVKEQVPEAKLKWAYGWGVYDDAHPGQKERKWKQDQIDLMKELGVEEMGKLNPKEVADLYLKANILAYPTEFYEIDCISVRKAQLAGCLPVTSDFAALNETNKHGIKIHSNKNLTTWGKKFSHGIEDKEAQDKWVTAVVTQLKTPIQDRQEMIDWAKGFNWEHIADVWNLALINP